MIYKLSSHQKGVFGDGERVENGTTTFSAPENATSTIAVSFSKPFKESPTVTGSRALSSEAYGMAIKNVTTTGFDIEYHNSTLGAVSETVNWMAVGR